MTPATVTYECCGRTIEVSSRLHQTHLRCPFCTAPLNPPVIPDEPSEVTP